MDPAFFICCLPVAILILADDRANKRAVRFIRAWKKS
jgi:hypothetical protein